MNKGKCFACQKTVYDLEGLTIGPHSEKVYHHKCFKCSEPSCTWKLNYTNYCYSDGLPWCKTHNPMTGVSNQVARSLSRPQSKNSSLSPSPSTSTPSIKKPVNSFCGHCGTAAESDSVFCGTCGNKL